MSNDVCGYVYPRPSPEAWVAVDEYISGSELGVMKITSGELFNYPSSFTPQDGTFIFLIGDRPGYPNATYLTDYNKYDPECSSIGFPCEPQERVKILLNVLADIALICAAQKIYFSISDSSQIEFIKKIRLCEMFEVVLSDFEKYQAPPDTLYEVQC